jgi:hypothetical protein
MEYIVLLIIILIVILLIINGKSFGSTQVPIKPLDINVKFNGKFRTNSQGVVVQGAQETQGAQGAQNNKVYSSKDKKDLLGASEISSLSNEKQLAIGKQPKPLIKTDELYYIDGSKRSQVYHVFANAYTFAEANEKCKKHNSRLASPSELKDIYDNGVYWCNWGWSSDGHAYMPNNDPKCNQSIGLLAGSNIDPYLKLGVNCYGTPYQ